MSVADLDAWRRVCKEAFSNLPTDTAVTMSHVDVVLLAGAREAVALDTSTTAGATQYERMLDRVVQVTGVDRQEVDAILTVCAQDAVMLVEDDR